MALPPFLILHNRMTFASDSSVIDNSSISFTHIVGTGSPTVADATDLATFLVSSINAVPTGGSQAPCFYLSPILSRAVNSILCQTYDVTNALLKGQKMGAPVAQAMGTLGASASPTTAFPEGVCVVVTIQAPYGSDVEFGTGTRPRARDRGRLYFGPWCGANIGAESGTMRAIVPSIAANNLLQWVKAISSHTTSGGSNYHLCVWSRASGTTKNVANSWVDDRFDYQRRRADQGVVRYSLAIP